MSSSDTGQTRLRSSQPAEDGPDQDAGQAPDSDVGNVNEELKQSEVPAIETSQAGSVKYPLTILQREKPKPYIYIDSHYGA